MGYQIFLGISIANSERAGHATIIPRQRDHVVCYCTITISGVATPSRHWPLNIFKLLLVPEALLRCRVVALSLSRSYTIVAAQLLLTVKEPMNAGARLLNNCYFILSFTGTITLMKIEQNGKMKKRNFWRRKHRDKISRARPELESVKKITLI